MPQQTWFQTFATLEGSDKNPLAVPEVGSRSGRNSPGAQRATHPMRRSHRESCAIPGDLSPVSLGGRWGRDQPSERMAGVNGSRWTLAGIGFIHTAWRPTVFQS